MTTTVMTAQELKRLHTDLRRLAGLVEQTSVGGSKQSHLIEAVRAAVPLDDVRRVLEGLERAYGILAMRGALEPEP